MANTLDAWANLDGTIKNTDIGWQLEVTRALPTFIVVRDIYADSFEAPAYIPGALVGQNGWVNQVGTNAAGQVKVSALLPAPPGAQSVTFDKINNPISRENLAKIDPLFYPGASADYRMLFKMARPGSPLAGGLTIGPASGDPGAGGGFPAYASLGVNTGSVTIFDDGPGVTFPGLQPADSNYYQYEIRYFKNNTLDFYWGGILQAAGLNINVPFKAIDRIFINTLGIHRFLGGLNLLFLDDVALQEIELQAAGKVKTNRLLDGDTTAAFGLAAARRSWAVQLTGVNFDAAALVTIQVSNDGNTWFDYLTQAGNPAGEAFISPIPGGIARYGRFKISLPNDVGLNYGVQVDTFFNV